jgi:hypothetical protein
MQDEIADARSARNPHGHIIIDGQQVADTLQCCHCGAHFVSVHGSGTQRGFCLRCTQVTCGGKACDPCVPFEKKVDEYERGKRAGLIGG